VVELCGELDLSTVERARRDLLELIPGTRVLALNAAGLAFCDVAGLRLLVQLLDQAKASGCSIVVTAASPALDWLLRSTDLAAIFGYSPVPASARDDLPRDEVSDIDSAPMAHFGRSSSREIW
jgi:anti-anti-sigma factor